MLKFKRLPIILNQIRKNSCCKKTSQVQSEFCFQTNSPRRNLLYNQNNFSNERISFIPQITSNLTTPATSDPDLKSSIHSTHSNSETLELFNKSSVVDFSIDEILTELGNESEISIVNKPTCFKNSKNPSCIDFMLTNK